MPKTSKAVPAIWSFRRKRALDWTITKWKARLCPHGGKQVEGIDFWETYAPVVAWSTVRLILILSMLTGMRNRQVDYVLAYTQAPIDCEIYMCIPAQFIDKDGSLQFSADPTAIAKRMFYYSPRICIVYVKLVIIGLINYVIACALVVLSRVLSIPVSLLSTTLLLLYMSMTVFSSLEMTKP